MPDRAAYDEMYPQATSLAGYPLRWATAPEYAAMVDIPAEHKLPRDDSVILTFFRVSDAPALQDLDADPEHRRRFEFREDSIPSLEHSERVISDWTRARHGGGPFVFAVRAVADGELLGGCEIRLLEHH